jgi:hypothetical protein
MGAHLRYKAAARSRACPLHTALEHADGRRTRPPHEVAGVVVLVTLLFLTIIVLASVLGALVEAVAGLLALIGLCTALIGLSTAVINRRIALLQLHKTALEVEAAAARIEAAGPLRPISSGRLAGEQSLPPRHPDASSAAR